MRWTDLRKGDVMLHQDSQVWLILEVDALGFAVRLTWLDLSCGRIKTRLMPGATILVKGINDVLRGDLTVHSEPV